MSTTTVRFLPVVCAAAAVQFLLQQRRRRGDTARGCAVLGDQGEELVLGAGEFDGEFLGAAAFRYGPTGAAIEVSRLVRASSGSSTRSP
jgi:hypothetical protein